MDQNDGTYYDIKNNTLSDIVAQVFSGRSITVPARSVKENVCLSDTSVKRLRRVTGVLVTPVDRTSDAVSDSSGAGGNGSDENDVGEKTVTMTQSQRAQALLDEYRDENRSPPLEYYQFIERAKEILGSDVWPSGTPKKGVVISLLENVIED